MSYPKAFIGYPCQYKPGFPLKQCGNDNFVDATIKVAGLIAKNAKVAILSKFNFTL